MATFNAKIVGIKELSAAFKEAPETTKPILQDALKRATVALNAHTDSNTVPFKRGDLIRSFFPADLDKLDDLIARWYPSVDYARAIQFGMPPSPGRYVPAIGKRLKNGANIGMWPGFRGRRYMQKILAAARGDMNDVFRFALKKVTQAIAKK